LQTFPLGTTASRRSLPPPLPPAGWLGGGGPVPDRRSQRDTAKAGPLSRGRGLCLKRTLSVHPPSSSLWTFFQRLIPSHCVHTGGRGGSCMTATPPTWCRLTTHTPSVRVRCRRLGEAGVAANRLEAWLHVCPILADCDPPVRLLDRDDVSECVAASGGTAGLPGFSRNLGVLPLTGASVRRAASQKPVTALPQIRGAESPPPDGRGGRSARVPSSKGLGPWRVRGGMQKLPLSATGAPHGTAL
jgi:hypothetical protein